jgi:hypothetical protein
LSAGPQPPSSLQEAAERLERLQRRRRRGNWRALALWIGGGGATLFGALAENRYETAGSVFIGAGLFLAGYYELEQQAVEAARDVRELAAIEAAIEAEESRRRSDKPHAPSGD